MQLALVFLGLVPVVSSYVTSAYSYLTNWGTSDTLGADLGPAIGTSLHNAAYGEVSRVVSAADFAAEALASHLQKSVLEIDDAIARRSFAKANMPGTPLPLNFWRATPCEIRCRVDGNYANNESSGYLVCSLILSEAGRPQLKADFARYYLIVANAEGQHAPSKLKTLGKLAAMSKQYAERLNQEADGNIMPHSAIRPFFDFMSTGRLAFSPYHAENHLSSFKIRMPPSAPGEDEIERNCKLALLLSEDKWSPSWPALVQEYPFIFYRLLADTRFGLPSKAVSAPCVVQPLLSLNYAPYVLDYAELARTFFDDLSRIKEAGGSGSPSAAAWSLNTELKIRGDPITELVCAKAIAALEQVRAAPSPGDWFIDLSHPVAHMTGSILTPQTTSVHGLDLFSRVLVLPSLPGLWIVVRKQNYADSFFPQSRSLISYQTTTEFTDWQLIPDRTADSRCLKYHKYHIHTRLKSLFIIVIHDSNTERYADWSNQALLLGLSRGRNPESSGRHTHTLARRPEKSRSESPSADTLGSSSGSGSGSAKQPTHPKGTASASGPAKLSAEQALLLEARRQAAASTSGKNPQTRPEPEGSREVSTSRNRIPQPKSRQFLQHTPAQDKPVGDSGRPAEKVAEGPEDTIRLPTSDATIPAEQPQPDAQKPTEASSSS